MAIRMFTSTIVVPALALVMGMQQGQDRATVQLRDGTRIEGRIEEFARGVLFLRVSRDDQRRINESEIALIDKKGAALGLPETELSEARGASHLLLLAGGQSQKGHLVGITGGQGSGDENQPRRYVFRMMDGREVAFAPDDVGRVYFGHYPFGATATAAATPSSTPSGLSPGDVYPGSIRVLAKGGWVSTGISVKKGERVTFLTKGEVQLSDNPGDRANPAGANRVARAAPLPSVNAGALIGRIGPMGTPFGIGDQTSVPMPADGVLFLGVNDDERTDNTGAFDVVVTTVRRR